VAESQYPPAPWHLQGQMWAGIFLTDNPVHVPRGLNRLFRPHWTIVILVRYVEGTLRYDELTVGAVVRRGLRVGLWVDRMWVNSEESLWGGRRIWGLPKDMAVFTWTGDQVTVTDHEGMIAAFTVNTRRARLPALWTPAPSIGRVPGYWAYAVARVWVHIGRSGIRVDSWSPRLPYQFRKHTPVFSFAGKPFRMTIPAPRLIPGEAV
jgi:hypothetical protein